MKRLIYSVLATFLLFIIIGSAVLGGIFLLETFGETAGFIIYFSIAFVVIVGFAYFTVDWGDKE